jgi:Flp pilus assembly protein TadB
LKGVLFLTLFLGFWFLFSEIRLVDHMAELMRKTRWDMDAAARQRALESRRNLLVLQQEHTLLYGLERELDYSGLRLRFPGLTSELWILGSLAAAACLFLFLSMSLGLWAAVIGNGALLAGEFLILRCLRTANLRAVNEHLMKLLDFLGNYSITAGDVAGIFHQVSRYMEEPIKSALDSCYYEAQITGDTALALRSMAEKIEHPKFKELARNMEVSLREWADSTALVAGSRRSLREYLRLSQERKGMLREALVNMVLLLGLSMVVLAAVGRMVQLSGLQILTGTVPGRIGLGVIGIIILLYIGQLQKMT